MGLFPYLGNICGSYASYSEYDDEVVFHRILIEHTQVCCKETCTFVSMHLEWRISDSRRIWKPVSGGLFVVVCIHLYATSVIKRALPASTDVAYKGHCPHQECTLYKGSPEHNLATKMKFLADVFLVFCGIQYQELWVLNKQLFFGKWFGTCVYTIAIAGIIQLIYPLHRID